MDVKLSIGEEDVGMSNPIKEEVMKGEMDSLKEEEIWMSRRERMNNALAAVRTAVRQEPEDLNVAAMTLVNVIKGADVEKFISEIERLANHTDLSATFNFQELSSGSLFHIAAETGKDDILRLLLDYVPDHIVAQDDRGDTPLHVAIGNKRSRAAAMLIRRARDLPIVEDKNRILRMQNKHGNTALHEAVLNCDVEMVNLLSEDLELVYSKNAEQKSPLYLALNTSKDIIEALFLLPLEPSSIEGLPPVHGAVVRRFYVLGAPDPSFTRQDTQKGHEAICNDSRGRNVFHFVAHTNRARVFKLLGPETKYLAQKRDMNGDLPIHIASKMGYDHLIQKLHPVSELPNVQGQTILHVAAKYGQTSTVRYILKHPELGKLINERDHVGNTPLHLAMVHAQPATLITLVLDKRIKPFLLNHDCLTAQDIAQNHYNRDYALRAVLAAMVLQSTTSAPTDFLVLRPEARDKTFRKVYSRKSIPNIDVLKDVVNTHLLVAALVATVTFTAGFAVPRGFNGIDTASKYDRGMATMLDKRLFQAFVICNTLAMFCSMITVIMLMYAQQGDFQRMMAAFSYTTKPQTIALPATSVAFVTGVTLTVGKLPWLAHTIFYLGLVFLFIISGATLLEYPPVFRSRSRPILLLKCWLILAIIYLWRIGTYVLDDPEEEGEQDLR